MMTGDICRELYVVRHGERVDFTFNDWIARSFDSAGSFVKVTMHL